jgi:hypothetical protein
MQPDGPVLEELYHFLRIVPAIVTGQELRGAAG